MSLALDVSPGSLIVLIGLMGSGKTAVGRALAQELKVKFADSDELIEKSAKLTFNSWARARPTVVLPEPIKPIKTISEPGDTSRAKLN